MKTLIFIAIIAFVAADSDYYSLGELDIHELKNNTDELKRLLDCLNGLGECSKLYSAYQVITEEAVQQACKRCSPYQKHVYWQFLQAVQTKFPSDYNTYKNKYDPENKYFNSLNSELSKYSITY